MFHRPSFHFDTEDTGPAYTQVQIQHRSRAPLVLSSAHVTANTKCDPVMRNMDASVRGDRAQTCYRLHLSLHCVPLCTLS